MKPILFTQISEVATNVEAVIKREKQEIGPRRFSFQTPMTPLNKRKDSLVAASMQYGKGKKNSPEYGRATGRRKGLGTRQPRKYDFKDQEMEGI